MRYALSEIRKTIVGFAAPAATVLIASVTSASDGGSNITEAEWVTAACTAVITSGTVFGVRNKPGKGKARKANVSEAAADPADIGDVYPTTPAHHDPGP